MVFVGIEMRNYSFFYFVLLNSLALAQSSVSQASFGDIPKNALKPVTVCEVLRNPGQFAGQEIAVIGRADSDENGMEYSLVEDHCQPPLRTGKFVWPNRIWIDCCDTFIPDPADKLLLDESIVRIKLDQLKRSTPLLTRKKIKFRVDGDVARADGFQDVRDFWEVAYGRIEIVDHLHSGNARRGGGKVTRGFGHPPVAPVQIVLRLNPVFIDDENSVVK